MIFPFGIYVCLDSYFYIDIDLGIYIIIIYNLTLTLTLTDPIHSFVITVGHDIHCYILLLSFRTTVTQSTINFLSHIRTK